MKKITFFMLVLTFIMFIFLGGVSDPMFANVVDDGDKDKVSLNIITVNKPQYDMVKSIVGDKHKIEYILSSEEDIKDFEYTKELVDRVSNKDIFIYSGNNFEPWVEEFIGELNKGKVGIIDISRGIMMLEMEDEDGESIRNPYYWCGINEYKIALYNVKCAIQDRDPQNRDFYEKNYTDIEKSLKTIEKELKEPIKELKKKRFITLNNSFDYLLNDLGLVYYDINKIIDLDQFLISKDIKREDVVLVADIRDSNEKLIPGYEYIKLDRYDGDKSFIDLLQKNIKTIFKDMVSVEMTKP